VGAVGYGGPAILALVRETFVTKKEWITETEFTNAMSLAQALPGANGVNVMGYIGFTIKRVWGGVLAALAFITPPTTLMILLSWAYFTYGQIPVVKSLFAGLGAIVVALLVNAVLVLGKSIFPTITWRHWRGLIVALTSFAGAYFWHFNVLWIVLTAGILGSVLFYFRNGPSPAAIPATALSEDTAVDKEAQPLRAKDLMPVLLIAGIVGVGLFIAATRALVTTFLGIGATAFGGGFGSIPLLQSQVVNAHGWLTNKEFVDGIALGQITPGPVFITATFIGYRVAGVLGAVMAMLAISLPSLTGIILLADLHGRIQNHKAVQSVIKGLQAGFVGLIISVTLQLGSESLRTWQEWLIFAAGTIYITVLKKNTVLAIGTTLIFSYLFIH